MAEIDNLIAEVNKKYKTDIIRKASDLQLWILSLISRKSTQISTVYIWMQKIQ